MELSMQIIIDVVWDPTTHVLHFPLVRLASIHFLIYSYRDYFFINLYALFRTGSNFLCLDMFAKNPKLLKVFRHNRAFVSIDDRQIIIIIFILHMITFPYFLDIDQGQNITLLTIVVLYETAFVFSSFVLYFLF